MVFSLYRHKQLPLAVALLSAGSALALTLLMTVYEQHWQLTQAHNQASLQAEHLKATLERSLSENLIVLEAAESMLQQDSPPSAAALKQLITPFTDKRPAITSLSLSQSDTAPMRYGSSSETTPVMLKISGNTLSASKHLYLYTTDTASPEYWGEISLQLNTPVLFPVFFNPEPAATSSYALRLAGDSNTAGIMFGDPKAFERPDLQLPLTMQNNAWELAATINTGALNNRWEVTVFTVAGIVASVILGILAGLLVLQWQKLHEKATVDALTQVLNRQTIQEMGQKEVERARRYRHPLSIIIVDLDDFKAVNDQYGHLAGDKVLQTTSSLIASAVRKTDLVGRFGGEEFIVILPESSTEEVATVAERIRANLDRCITINHTPHPLSASLGTAALAAADTFGSLFNKADAALYQAKSAGKNCVKPYETKKHQRVSHSVACAQT